MIYLFSLPLVGNRFWNIASWMQFKALYCLAKIICLYNR